jgi:cholest-4-en-3-one 26-monooxygenase
MSLTTDRIDLFDPATFAAGPPHELFDVLRREAPVYWNPREDDPDGGFWALTRHADVVAVSRDPARFTSSHGFAAPRREPDNPAFYENIMYRDPPGHTDHRRPLNRTFTPKAMGDFEPMVRTITRQILDGLAGLSEFDWVPRVAAELPARVVASVIGVPEADQGKVVEWASDIFGRDGTPERDARFAAAVGGIMQYAGALTAEKRACPVHDVMSLLTETEVAGAPLSDLTLHMWFLSLAQAGFETTHTLIAQSMLLLSVRPDLRERLIQDPGTIPRCVEELLRYITPVNMMARTATEDIELHGTQIHKGQYVTMWYCATNRDPEVFEAPHEFRVDRGTTSQQAFGAAGSPHYCLGAHLARLEMRVLLEELVSRGVPFEVSGPAVRVPGVFLNALAELPVRAKPADA